MWSLNSNSKIPTAELNYSEISKMMRINVDILMKELTDHCDKEIKRFKEEINECDHWK